MQTGSHHIAKISKPSLPDVVPRKRLFRLLDQGSRAPITWLSGPAGSGKTTLAASWLNARELPCIWYQVDAGDDDLATFFYYLCIASKKAAPRAKRPLPLLTPEYLMDVPTFSRRFFEDLCARLKPPFIVVFDNYQEVPAESPFHEILLAGLSAIPEGVRVVIISRGVPPKAFMGMEAGNRMSSIGWDEIRFTPEESRGMVRLHVRARQKKESLEWIHERTRGWAAGLVLLAKAAKAQTIEPEAFNDVAPENIFDYFANELFDRRTDESPKDFLLKTAYLQKITPRAAEQISGNKEAGRILSELYHRNYFTEKRSHPELSYQYHALFREFLLHRAEQEYPETERTRLNLTAARLMEEAGQIESAADLYRGSSDWEGLMRIVFTHAPALLGQGRNRVLEQWITSIPEAAQTGNPRLLYWLGFSRMPMNIAESIQCFERSFRLFEAQGDVNGAYLAWSAVVTAIMHEWSDYTRLDPWIAWMENALELNPSFESPEVETTVIAGMAAALSRRRPDHPEFNKYLERALLLTRQGDPRLFVDVRFIAIWYNLYMGNADRVGELMEELRLCAKKTMVTPFSNLLINFMESNVNTYHHDRADKGLQILQECHRISEDAGVHVLDHYFGTQAAYFLFNKGRPDLSGEYLAKAKASISEQQKDSQAHCLFLMGWKELLLNNIYEARAHAEKSLALSLESGVPTSELLCRILLAHVLITQKNHPAALRATAEATRIADRIKSGLMKNRSLLAEAQIAFAIDEQQQGLDALRRAFTIGREKNIVNLLFHWQPGVMADLCARALEAGIEVEYAKRLIRELRLMPETPPLHLETWPWPLKIYTLGRFRVEKHGKPLPGTQRFSRKVPQKQLELLKLLVALGGRAVEVERISDALWPDAEGDAGQKALSVTLARLRDLLGVQDAIVTGDGAVRLNERLVWTDAGAFEYLLKRSEFGVPPIKTFEGRLRSEPPSPSPLPAGERIKVRGTFAIEKALALYQGAFLEGETAFWAIPMRERLREAFVRSAEKAGRLHEDHGDWDKAIEIYRRGLEVDELVEQFYVGLMSCHRRQGRPAEAISVYEYCRRVFGSYNLPLPERIEEEHTFIRNQRKF